MEPALSIATGSAVPPAGREATWRAFQAVKAADSRRLFEELGVETAADFFEHCVDAHPGRRAGGFLPLAGVGRPNYAP